MLLLYGEAVTSGVKGIFTMHGKFMEDLKNNKDVYKLIETNQIEKIRKDNNINSFTDILRVYPWLTGSNLN